MKYGNDSFSNLYFKQITFLYLLNERLPWWGFRGGLPPLVFTMRADSILSDQEEIRMDASEYLRYKKAAMGGYISRRQPPMDAGLHTEIRRKAADRYFVSENNNAATIHVLPCKTSKVAYGGDYVAPVKPASGCSAAAACAQLSDPYEVGGIAVPCCPFPYTSTSYVGPCVSHCAVGTQSTIAYASRLATNKIRGDCCE
jgi:hypothetical protein